MRIFISHALDDEVLASKLKNFLEKHEQIEEAYMAVRSPAFELEISEKVTREIRNSDYLIAIITEASKYRPSVHQEIGFAQGINVHKIPLVEINAKKGVLLEGRDHISFDREKFDDACKQVLDYIIKHGPTRKKFTEEEEHFIQKSAHFRSKLDDEMITFLHGLIYDLQIHSDAYHLFSSNKGREKAHNILENFSKDKEIMYKKVGSLPLHKLFRISSDFDFFSRQIEDAKQLPHTELLLDEQDAFLKLNERILEARSSLVDLQGFFYNVLKTNVDANITFSQLIKSRKDLPSLPNNLGGFVYNLHIITKATVKMDKILLQIRNKFGNIAFKIIYDDESA